MQLFNETENKYYEIIAYLLRKHENWTNEELMTILKQNAVDDDFEVIESIFSKKEGEECIFEYYDGCYYALLPNDFPVRCTVIERNAANVMVRNPYANVFLNAKTIDKLHSALENSDILWDESAINVKNQFVDGDSIEGLTQNMHIIINAIREGKAIQYDNIKPGVFSYINTISYPVKLEYSFLNDRFRLIAYAPEAQRFIKLNISLMKNVLVLDNTYPDLQEMYQTFLKQTTRKVVLSVDPVDHVIERCFRIFSYYSRKARFDKDANQYRLEIAYSEFDENEIIRDIMSLGSSVVVLEPKKMQKTISERIRRAFLRYQE